MGTDTRERILESSYQAILAKSFNGVGLNEILACAGVPKGSFYHYFKSKEELGISVVEKASNQYAETLRSILQDRSRKPVGRLRYLYELARVHVVEQGFQRECIIPKMALEIANLSEPIRAAIKSGFDQARSIMAQCIREGQAAGDISREFDPESLADFLMSSWEGVTIRMQIDRDSSHADKFITYIFDCLLKA